MHPLQKTTLAFAIFASATAFAGDAAYDKKTIAPIEQDKWKFMLAMPGFAANIDGQIGLGNAVSDVDVSFGDILPKIDMIFAARAEASYGRFGILGELIYLSGSDGIGTDSVIQKVDVQLDQYLADFAVRWRIIESERGYLDVLAGVRYTNLYQAVRVQSNDQEISEVAENFTDEVSDRLRERITDRLSEGRFRTALKTAVTNRITSKIAASTGPNPPEHDVPVAPLAARRFGRIDGILDRLIRRRTAQVIVTARAELQQAAAAERAAAQQAVASERARLQARAAALRTRVNQRIAQTQKDLQDDVEKALEKTLNQSFTRADDWWDPYIGVRARYNFSPTIYVIARGDIGGFGVGSDLMWQGECALGFQLTSSIYTEIGYRALSFDYEDNGLTYDTITHGAQLTLGIQF